MQLNLEICSMIIIILSIVIRKLAMISILHLIIHQKTRPWRSGMLLKSQEKVPDLSLSFFLSLLHLLSGSMRSGCKTFSTMDQIRPRSSYPPFWVCNLWFTIVKRFHNVTAFMKLKSINFPHNCKIYNHNLQVTITSYNYNSSWNQKFTIVSYNSQFTMIVSFMKSATGG